MPVLDITIDDRSPLIDYYPVNAWALQNNTSDSEITCVPIPIFLSRSIGLMI